MTQFAYWFALLVAPGVLFAPLVSGQGVMGGPPPEVRSHIDALVRALNSGSSDQWEKIAQEHLSPIGLKRHSAADRKQLFDSIRRDFGTISLGRVEGPDQPLQLHIKGSTGAIGVIELTLQQGAPYKIEDLGIKFGGADRGKSQPNVGSPPVRGDMSNEQIADALDLYFEKLVAKDVFSGNVLVAKDGDTIYHKSYGFADRANKVPNNSSTRFNLGSINKSFTKAAIQQLIARGKLSISDTVGKLLLDYSQQTTRTATVDQLLSHTAGVADFFGEEFTHTAKNLFRSNADYYKFVSGLKPQFAPGTRHQYCNGCYILLGAIIERISGVPYEQYVEEQIFKPAGMATAGSLQSDGIIANIAVGYTRQTWDGQLRSNLLLQGASGCAAGGGYATTADLLAYDKALRHGRIPDIEPSNGLSIAGGAPGINSMLEQNGPWTVVVLANLDPPAAEDIGRSLTQALSR